MNMEGFLSDDVPIDLLFFILQGLVTIQVSKLLDGHALMGLEQLDQVLIGGGIVRWDEAVVGGGRGVVSCDLV